MFPVRTRGGLHNTQGDRRVKSMHTLGLLPPIGFLFEHVVVDPRMCPKKCYDLTTTISACASAINGAREGVVVGSSVSQAPHQTYWTTSPKTDVVPFQRPGASGATHFK